MSKGMKPKTKIKRKKNNYKRLVVAVMIMERTMVLSYYNEKKVKIFQQKFNGFHPKTKDDIIFSDICTMNDPTQSSMEGFYDIMINKSTKLIVSSIKKSPFSRMHIARIIVRRLQQPYESRLVEYCDVKYNLALVSCNGIYGDYMTIPIKFYVSRELTDFISHINRYLYNASKGLSFLNTEFDVTSELLYVSWDANFFVVAGIVNSSETSSKDGDGDGDENENEGENNASGTKTMVYNWDTCTLALQNYYLPSKDPFNNNCPEIKECINKVNKLKIHNIAFLGGDYDVAVRKLISMLTNIKNPIPMKISLDHIRMTVLVGLLKQKLDTGWPVSVEDFGWIINYASTHKKYFPLLCSSIDICVILATHEVLKEQRVKYILFGKHHGVFNPCEDKNLVQPICGDWSQREMDIYAHTQLIEKELLKYQLELSESVPDPEPESVLASSLDASSTEPDSTSTSSTSSPDILSVLGSGSGSGSGSNSIPTS